MRGVLLFGLVVAAVGCVPNQPREEVANAGPAVAAMAISVFTKSDVKPNPDAGDKCENCDGKGEVGDGRVMIKCRVCNGTGKKKKTTEGDRAAAEPELLKASESSEPKEEPKPESAPQVEKPEPDEVAKVPPAEPVKKEVAPEPKKAEIIRNDNWTGERVITVFTRDPCIHCDRWIEGDARVWNANGYTVKKAPARDGKPVPYFLVSDEFGRQVFLAGLTWPGYQLFLQKKKEEP